MEIGDALFAESGMPRFLYASCGGINNLAI
uniref:Uncharacterized protein n=1 Tax=Musa acuminata subsp. malaccensis TaxID=214687 RepID=A0A804JNR5_MUSAM